MHKDVLEENFIKRWSVIVSLIVFLIIGCVFLVIYFVIRNNPNIITNHSLALVIILLAIFVFFITIRQVFVVLAKHLNDIFLKRFSLLAEYNSYKESMARVYMPDKKYDHAVLLLHGFGYGTDDFAELLQPLQENGIGYLAPMLTGFGNTTADLLCETRYEHWLRDAICAFDYLDSIAEKVSVVGHSLGTLLAAHIAKIRSVNCLILSAPAFYAHGADYIKYAKIPVISKIVSFLLPYAPKASAGNRPTADDILNKNAALATFQYMALPMDALRELAIAVAKVRIEKMNFNDLIVIYGGKDETINIARTISDLDAHGYKYSCYGFDNTAHHTFKDNDKSAVCALVIKHLLGVK